MVLRAKNIPCAFATGYDARVTPPEFADVTGQSNRPAKPRHSCRAVVFGPTTGNLPLVCAQVRVAAVRPANSAKRSRRLIRLPHRGLSRRVTLPQPEPA